MRHEVASQAKVSLARIVIGACALACDVSLAALTPKLHSDRDISKQALTSAVTAPRRSAVQDGEKWPLRIANLRIEDAPPGERKPSAVLKFQALNAGSSQLVDIVLELSIVEQPEADHPIARTRLLAGPFTFRGKAVLEPGYMTEYELLLRNFSSDCRCVPKIEVVSLRALPRSTSELSEP